MHPKGADAGVDDEGSDFKDLRDEESNLLHMVD